MNFTPLYYSLICALFCGVALGRPQQFTWNELFASTPNPPQHGGAFRPGRPGANQSSFIATSTLRPATESSTVAPTSSVTPPSPQYLACLQACPSTMQYNPVCGSDNQNYHNDARLQCAVRCGQNVVAVRMGTCNPM